MKRHRCIGTAFVCGLDGDFILKYYVTYDGCSGDAEQSYGIEVEKNCGSAFGGISEKRQIGGICNKEEEAELFARVLLRNTVTPMAVADVIYDLIVDKYMVL